MFDRRAHVKSLYSAAVELVMSALNDMRKGARAPNVVKLGVVMNQHIKNRECNKSDPMKNASVLNNCVTDADLYT